MYHTYILYSQNLDKYYIGATGDDLTERIRKHNTNHKGFTGGNGDWELKYNESFEDKSTAKSSATNAKLYVGGIIIKKRIRKVY